MYFNGLGFYEGFAGVPWHRYRALYVRFFLVLNVSPGAFLGALTCQILLCTVLEYVDILVCRSSGI